MFNLLLNSRLKSDFRYVRIVQLNQKKIRNFISTNFYETSSVETRGLLSGTDASTSSYYSDKLSLPNAHTLLKSSNQLYIHFLNLTKGVKEADISIQNILINAKKFFDKNEVWDRTELVSSLRKVTSTESGGNFCCLLGGKNTGKSLVLSSLFSNPKIFVIDLRMNRNMAAGLINVLKQKGIKNYENAHVSVLHIPLNITQNFLKAQTGVKFDLNEVANAIIGRPNNPQLLQSVIIDMIASLGCITLVFDEANLALDINDSTSDTDVENAKDALALFTLLTKQSQLLNVVLVSSEHSFPSRLKNSKLSFSLQNFTDYLFVGEVPPNEMYRLLTTEWKIEPDISKMLIDVYGGHIWDVYQALRRLEDRKKGFVFLNSHLTTNIQDCVNWKGDEKDNNFQPIIVYDNEYKKRMIDTLEQLAIKGFVPLNNAKDPIAIAISQFGVGGVVTNDSRVIGLDIEVWNKYPNVKFGIIPTKQSMRLAIAEFLEIEKKVD